MDQPEGTAVIIDCQGQDNADQGSLDGLFAASIQSEMNRPRSLMLMILFPFRYQLGDPRGQTSFP